MFQLQNIVEFNEMNILIITYSRIFLTKKNQNNKIFYLRNIQECKKMKHNRYTNYGTFKNHTKKNEKMFFF